MRDINKIMPKLPPKMFGTVMNFYPDDPTQKAILQTMPFDSKWHFILKESENSLIIDGVSVKRPGASRYT